MDNYGFQKITHTKPRKPQALPVPTRGKVKPERDKLRSWSRVDKRAAWG